MLDTRLARPSARTPRAAVAAGLLTAVALAVGGCSAIEGVLDGDRPARDAVSGEVVDAGDADVFQMRVGDCFDDQDGTEVSELPAVPCSTPHDNEIYHTFDLPDGDFPGSDAVDEQANAGCAAEFDGFVGLAYDSSELDWFAIYPTEGSWQSGDREVLCALWDPAGPVTGSLRGVAR